MNKYIAITTAVLLSVLSANAQYTMKVIQDNGKASVFQVSTIKEVIWENPEEPIHPEPGSETHEYVDLGLPSGILWATCNVGAAKPEDYGGYYAWGETEEKNYYSWDTYKWCDNSSELSISKYCTKSNNGTVDGLTILEPGDDVAHVKWGGSWRMPTLEEWDELIQYCTSKEETLNGVKGTKFTGKRNGNSIFLPYAGYREDDQCQKSSKAGLYWSSLLYNSQQAYDCSFYRPLTSWTVRYYGLTVRPVNYEYTVRVSGVSLNKSAITLAVRSSEPLSAIFSPSNAYNQNVVWSSTNANVATVDANGVVTAVQLGTATITAKSKDGGYTATCSVNVVSRESIVPEAVDLGLPSGLKWANFNVGATKPEEYGEYYAWGETEEKYYYDWDTYKWAGDSRNVLMSKYRYSVDSLTILEPEDDVAHVKWGGSWRMPTIEEFDELEQYCTSEETILKGVKGLKLTSKRNGNSIFLPYAGLRNDDLTKFIGESFYCWTSSLLLSGYRAEDAYSFRSYNQSLYRSVDKRYCGVTVRPVSE